MRREHAGVWIGGDGKFQAIDHQRFVDEKNRQHGPTHKGQNIGRAARHDDHHDHRHQRPPEQSADFLHFGDVRHVHALGGFEGFFAGDGSFLFVQLLGLGGGHGFGFGRVGGGCHFGGFGQDEPHVLQRAECAAVGEGKEQGYYYSRPFKLRRKQRGQAWAFELAGVLFLLPLGRFRQEGADDNQRDGGDQSAHQCVAPNGCVASVRYGTKNAGEPVRHHRQPAAGAGDLRKVAVNNRHREAAYRGEGLGVAQNFFALHAVGEQFRQPGHRRHKLHAHTDEHEAPEKEQLIRRGGKARAKRRHRIKQYAVSQHSPSAKQICQVTAQQTKDAAANGRHKKDNPKPMRKLRRARPHPRQVHQRILADQRQHQQLVDVEQKPQRGDEADQPLGSGELEF